MFTSGEKTEQSVALKREREKGGGGGGCRNRLEIGEGKHKIKSLARSGNFSMKMVTRQPGLLVGQSLMSSHAGDKCG